MTEGQAVDPAALPSVDEGERGAGSRTLGLERWVQFAFIAAALMGVWLLDHVITSVWDLFAEPDPTMVTVASIVSSIVLATLCYRNVKIHTASVEVAAELEKVTWPPKSETWPNTGVVLLTSAIAAVILFVFDFAWSKVTDLIY